MDETETRRAEALLPKAGEKVVLTDGREGRVHDGPFTNDFGDTSMMVDVDGGETLMVGYGDMLPYSLGAKEAMRNEPEHRALYLARYAQVCEETAGAVREEEGCTR